MSQIYAYIWYNKDFLNKNIKNYIIYFFEISKIKQ